MNYVKAINEKRAIEKQLVDEIKHLCKMKDIYYENRKNGKDVSIIGMQTIPNSIVLGLGFGKPFASLKNIEELEDALQACREALVSIRQQIDELEEEREATMTQAKLIVDGSRVYIDGDPRQVDLLSKITYLREKEKQDLQQTLQSPEFLNAIAAKAKLEEIFTSYKLPTPTEPLGQDILVVERALAPDLTNITEMIEGHLVPSFDFSEVAIVSLEMQIKKANDDIEKYKNEIDNFTPSFLGKIFPKKREEEMTAFHTKRRLMIDNAREKLNYAKRALVIAKKLSIDYVAPYVRDGVGKQIDVCLNDLTEDAKHLLFVTNKQAQRIENGEATPFAQVDRLEMVVPQYITQYLDDNNLRLTIKDLVDTVLSMDELDEGMKKEVCRLFCDYTYRETKPGVVIKR